MYQWNYCDGRCIGYGELAAGVQVRPLVSCKASDDLRIRILRYPGGQLKDSHGAPRALVISFYEVTK